MNGTVRDMATARVDLSDDPHQFETVMRQVETATFAGLDIAHQQLPADPVQLAAEIEALAGLRRIAALRHPHGCPCDPCRVRRAALTAAFREDYCDE